MVIEYMLLQHDLQVTSIVKVLLLADWLNFKSQGVLHF